MAVQASDGDAFDWDVATDLLVGLAAAELELPHVVVCSAGGAATASYSGPYPNALEAARAAECERRAEASFGGTHLVFSVVALYPALSRSHG